MADEEQQELSLTQRLLQRSGHGLHRQRMPDGGEVFGGPMAQRALDAVGARAMTMDGTIFVGNDFDGSSPEDLALYAHEGHHQDESGGHNPHSAPRDEEEVAARAVERMVLHRAQAGEAVPDILGDTKGGNFSRGGASEASGGTAPAAPGDATEEEAMAAYKALRAEGKSHQMIIQELADFVVRSVSDAESENAFRRPT